MKNMQNKKRITLLEVDIIPDLMITLENLQAIQRVYALSLCRVETDLKIAQEDLKALKIKARLT